MAAFLLILFAVLPGGGLDITWNMPTIIMGTMQSDNTIAQSLNVSSLEPESPEINAARAKVQALEDKVWWVKTMLIVALVLAGVIGLAIAVVTLRSDWTNDDLRTAEKELSALEIAKVQADSKALLKIETDKVRIELAAQQERAAKAERALLELQERVKDRHLSAENKLQLIHRLAIEPKGQLEIRCPIGNPEARNFTLELVQAFRASGWDVTLNDRVIIMPTPVGLKLLVHSEQPTAREGELVKGEAPQRTNSILKAFKDSHLSIEVQFDQNVPKQELSLIVGFKP